MTDEASQRGENVRETDTTTTRWITGGDGSRGSDGGSGMVAVELSVVVGM